MSKSRKSQDGHPNSIKSYHATRDALAELLPYYINDPQVVVHNYTLLVYTIFFERLNFEEKWKPNSPEWEQEICKFAENHAKEIREEHYTGGTHKERQHRNLLAAPR